MRGRRPGRLSGILERVGRWARSQSTCGTRPRRTVPWVEGPPNVCMAGRARWDVASIDDGPARWSRAVGVLQKGSDDEVHQAAGNVDLFSDVLALEVLGNPFENLGGGEDVGL